MGQDERPTSQQIMKAVHRLVEDNRLQRLRFMKEDYLLLRTEADLALAEIESRGDRQAWTEARTMRIWLSRSINAAS